MARSETGKFEKAKRVWREWSNESYTMSTAICGRNMSASVTRIRRLGGTDLAVRLVLRDFDESLGREAEQMIHGLRRRRRVRVCDRHDVGEEKRLVACRWERRTLPLGVVEELEALGVTQTGFECDAGTRRAGQGSAR